MAAPGAIRDEGLNGCTPLCALACSGFLVGLLTIEFITLIIDVISQDIIPSIRGSQKGYKGDYSLIGLNEPTAELCRRGLLKVELLSFDQLHSFLYEHTTVHTSRKAIYALKDNLAICWIAAMSDPRFQN